MSGNSRQVSLQFFTSKFSYNSSSTGFHVLAFPQLGRLQVIPNSVINSLSPVELPDQSLIFVSSFLVSFLLAELVVKMFIPFPNGAAVLSPPSRDVSPADMRKFVVYWNFCLVVVPHRVSYLSLISFLVEFLLCWILSVLSPPIEFPLHRILCLFSSKSLVMAM